MVLRIYRDQNYRDNFPLTNHRTPLTFLVDRINLAILLFPTTPSFLEVSMRRSLKVVPAKSRKPSPGLGFADFMSGIIAAVVVEQYRQRECDAGFISYEVFCAILHDWQRCLGPFADQLVEVDFYDVPEGCCHSGKIRSFLAGSYLRLHPQGDWIILQPSVAHAAMQDITEEFGHPVVGRLESAAKVFLSRWHQYESGQAKHGVEPKPSRK